MKPKIAITGHSCAFADIASPEQFWQGLLEKRRFPTDLICVDQLSAPKATSEGLDEIFVWLEHCTTRLISKLDGKRVGIVLGNLAYPTRLFNRYLQELAGASKGPVGTKPINRFNSGYPALWLAKQFGFRGPAYCIDAACASALYALKLGCYLLSSGECDVVLTGGINAVDPKYLQNGFAALGALSPSGRASPYSIAADGLVPARGAALFSLQRLDRLGADETPLAIVRGMGFSNDGRQGGLLAPSLGAQIATLRRTYEASGIKPEALSFVECHATGTPVGDLCEIKCLTEVFGEAKALAIGICKANTGHLLAASAAISMLKVIESFRQQKLPPNLIFAPLREEISASRLVAEQGQLCFAKQQGPLLAGINAFGFGGNNAHIILESPWQGDFASVCPERFCKASAPDERLGELDARNADIVAVSVASRLGSSSSLSALEQDCNTSEKISSITLDLEQRYFPPKDAAEILPQQLLLLPLLEEALAQLQAPLPQKTSVLVGMATASSIATLDYQHLTPVNVLGCMPNIPANRINAIKDYHGLSFAVLAEDLSGLRAIQIACHLLASGESDAVIVGAIDFSSPLDSKCLKALGLEKLGFSSDGGIIVILRRATDAKKASETPLFAIKEWDSKPSGITWRASRKFPYAADSLFAMVASYMRNFSSGIGPGRINLSLPSCWETKETRLNIEAYTPPSPRDYRCQKALRLNLQGFKVPEAFAKAPKRESLLKYYEASYRKKAPRQALFNRSDLVEHACGKISHVFGKEFIPLDNYSIRVRMPMGPFLLTDSVLAINAQALSMQEGTITTVTTVDPQGWYLHQGRMPAGILIEAGQADLLLVSYLGVDLEQRGQRAYRLLGCDATYYGDLPKPKDRLIFKISIDRHAKAGNTRLFFFHYDCYCNDRLILKIRNGRAGFFSKAELAKSSGVIFAPHTVQATWDFSNPIAKQLQKKRSFDASQLRALQAGDPVTCFGDQYRRLASHNSTPLPASKHSFLLECVPVFDPKGGAWQRGYLKAQRRIHSDDWFFAGHFPNDPCMPGTLMTDMCFQALAFYMIAGGMTLTRDAWRFAPTQAQLTQLQCRGQVTPASQELILEVFVRKLYNADEIRILADVLVTVDGLKALYAKELSLSLVPGYLPTTPCITPKAVASFAGIRCDEAQIAAAISGPASKAFGPIYAEHESCGQRIARLPASPYNCISRIEALDGPYGAMKLGTKLVAKWDECKTNHLVCKNAGQMPLCIFQEALLQPCGWLASYMGCGARGNKELFFRNLDGELCLEKDWHKAHALCIKAKNTGLSSLGSTIILGFAVKAFNEKGDCIAKLTTSFGYFSSQALMSQSGIALSKLDKSALKMLDGPQMQRHEATKELKDYFDSYEFVASDSGRQSFYRAKKQLDPRHWLFKVHFFQDPVMPGSFGVESAFQALKHTARYTKRQTDTFTKVVWTYRGQILPEDTSVTTLGVEDESKKKQSTSIFVNERKIYEINFIVA